MPAVQHVRRLVLPARRLLPETVLVEYGTTRTQSGKTRTTSVRQTAQPPPGASREEIKRYRAAIRKAAIENVRKTTAETAELAARHAMLQRAKQKQPAGS